jgi:hypothetical protein
LGTQSLEERKSQEGRGVRADLNRPSGLVTLIVGSKALELRVVVLESSSDWQARWQERQEGIGRGNPVRICDVVNSLKGKP